MSQKTVRWKTLENVVLISDKRQNKSIEEKLRTVLDSGTPWTTSVNIWKLKRMTTHQDMEKNESPSHT